MANGWRGPEDQRSKGRPVGSKNKATQAIRIAYQKLTEENLENMSIWLAQVAAENPEKAMQLMLQLSEFIIPKLARTELTNSEGGDLFQNVQFQFGPPVNDPVNRIQDWDIEDANLLENE